MEGLLGGAASGPCHILVAALGCLFDGFLSCALKRAVGLGGGNGVVIMPSLSWRHIILMFRCHVVSSPQTDFAPGIPASRADIPHIWQCNLGFCGPDAYTGLQPYPDSGFGLAAGVDKYWCGGRSLALQTSVIISEAFLEIYTSGEDARLAV